MNLLPAEIWCIIFSFDSQVYFKGVQLNWEFHNLLVTLVLPKLGKSFPSSHEILNYIYQIDQSNDLVLFTYSTICNQPGWKELEYNSNDKYYTLNTWSPIIMVENYQFDQLLSVLQQLIDDKYYVDPLAYRTIISKRKSCQLYLPNYIDNSMLYYINEFLRNCDHFSYHRKSALKWKLLHRIISTMTTQF